VVGVLLQKYIIAVFVLFHVFQQLTDGRERLGVWLCSYGLLLRASEECD
jgi:hypothetical protein